MNPIPAENQLAGDPAWLAGPDSTGHEIEGYADGISARAGESVPVRVSSTQSTTATWALYRLGWYGGAGARLVRGGGPVPVGPQAACPMEQGTGLVRCNWPAAFTLELGAQDVSGLYALKLVRQDGKTRFIPLVVIDGRPADLLFQASVQTWEAYNAWGGESLYSDAARTTAHGYATKVSFDRPFDDQRGLGQMLAWEAALARFLERHGYDVSYATNLDVATGGAGFLERAGMFLSVGHDEYWAGAERSAVEEARNAGVPLAFFSSNSAYWKVRYEDFSATGSPRTLACYKAGDDPVGAGASGMFRGAAVGAPENALLGVMYDGWQFVAAPFVVGDSGAWLYQGTGLKSGDPVYGIVGHEFDRRFDNGREPEGVTVLARSPVVDSWGKPGWSEAVSYRAGSGALVFASGSIYWSRGLDPLGVPDARVERMTANVLHEALSLAIPSTLGEMRAPAAPAPVMGPVQATVSTLARGLAGPAGLAVIPQSAPRFAGYVVVTSTGTGQVLLVDPASGAAQPLAGGFEAPVAVAADADGRVYVADSSASVIRRIDADAAHTVTTLAGMAEVPGEADGTGTAARFSRPMGVALLPGSSTLYVADAGNHRIRAVDLTTFAVTTVAGSVAGDADGPAVNARFFYPTGVAAAPDGRLFVLSSHSRKVKVILADASRTVVTLAGGAEGFADGAGDVAQLSPQMGAAWAGTFLAVSDPSSLRVRSIAPGSDAAATQVYTLAFSGRSGSVDGPAAQAEIQVPEGLAAADNGRIYVSDAAAGLIRVIAP